MSFCSLSPFFLLLALHSLTFYSPSVSRASPLRAFFPLLSRLLRREEGVRFLVRQRTLPRSPERPGRKETAAFLGHRSFFFDVESMWLTKLLATVRSAASPSFVQRASARFSPVLGAVAE